MKVPQKYILVGLGVLIVFIVVLHRLSKHATVPMAEQIEAERDWVDEKDPVTGV